MRLSIIIAVMSGGALGALCRYLTGAMLQNIMKATSFPLATLTVNVVGSFLLSMLFHLNTSQLSHTLRLAIGTGFLGAFTTFSTFELEAYALLHKHNYFYAAIYVLGNLLLGFAAILLGRYLALRIN